ncbi:hypothetical protein IL306_005589, partial [Fusarium sp. DS 682]
GVISTKWQPSKADEVSYLTVSFAEKDLVTTVREFYFDWAQSPPVNVTVLFHNKTLDNPAKAHALSGKNKGSGYQVVASIKKLRQSGPYDVKTTDLDAVVLPTGNTTNATLSKPVPLSRYATLLIYGNQALDDADKKAKNGTGATVAEWAILH